MCKLSLESMTIDGLWPDHDESNIVETQDPELLDVYLRFQFGQEKWTMWTLSLESRAILDCSPELEVESTVVVTHEPLLSVAYISVLFVLSLYEICMFPFESIAIDDWLSTEPTSMIREGIEPPEFVGMAFGDIVVLFVKMKLLEL